MTFFYLMDFEDKRIGSTVYFRLDLARTAARRTATIRNKAAKAGKISFAASGVRIMKNDGAIYDTKIETVAL